MEDVITRREHNEFAKRMEDEHNRQNFRISKLEKEVEQNNKLLVAVEKLALNMENMQKEQIDQGERLEKLESRDGDMWRTIMKYVVTAIIGIVIGFLFKNIGI